MPGGGCGARVSSPQRCGAQGEPRLPLAEAVLHPPSQVNGLLRGMETGTTARGQAWPGPHSGPHCTGSRTQSCEQKSTRGRFDSHKCHLTGAGDRVLGSKVSLSGKNPAKSKSVNICFEKPFNYSAIYRTRALEGQKSRGTSCFSLILVFFPVPSPVPDPPL